MIITQLALAIPFAFLLGDKVNQPFWLCLYYLLVYTLSLLLIIVVPPKLAKFYQSRKKSQQEPSNLPELQTTREEIGLSDFPTLIDIGLAPIAYVAYLIVSFVCTSAMSVFPWFNAEETQDVGFSYFITTQDRVFAMLATVFIAPIAEEIIMRGWLYGKLRAKLKIPLAMIITSFVFALLHGQWNVGVSVFALSLILCGLREITGTIWSGMLLHMLSNGIAFYLLYIAF